MSKRSMSLIMTAIVMIFIVSIIGFARLSLRIVKGNNGQIVADEVELIDEKGLNNAETNVLRKLSVFMSISEGHSTRISTTEMIYFTYLSDYYRRDGVNLSNETADKIFEFISNGDNLILLENERDIKKMSYDGREVAIYILKQIYELSNLKLTINSNGMIEQIEDLSRAILYQNNRIKQGGFQWENLILTLLLIITLLGILFIISKRKQVYKKGGKFNGFKEKRIA